MSGGIAWVLDTEGTLAQRINTGLVRLHPLSTDQAVELRHLLERHVQATGSPKATEILKDFDHWLLLFRSVVSDEYLHRL